MSFLLFYDLLKTLRSSRKNRVRTVFAVVPTKHICFICAAVKIFWFHDRKYFNGWKYLCWTRPGTCLTNVLISITGLERDHHHRQELGIFQIITLTMTADSSYIFWQFQIDLQILTPGHLVVFHSFHEWQVNSAIMLVMIQSWSWLWKLNYMTSGETQVWGHWRRGEQPSKFCHLIRQLPTDPACLATDLQQPIQNIIWF